MKASEGHTSNNLDSRKPPLPATETTRIYVGGLGESVTADDLRKTFSSLGSVEAVDVIRTKGRSFAYVNFLPSTDKSLSKLFSAYSGCLWKGGRLRIEKAREHYFDRLRSEWAEDGENGRGAHNNDADARKNIVSSVKAGRDLDAKALQIRIFFPKLRKVKSLPCRGSGKHKYSFRRFESSVLPLHICDCPQHSGPIQTAKRKEVDDPKRLNGGMNEEEVNLMNSIMGKLFERESDSKTVCIGPYLSPQRDVESLDDAPADKSEDHDATDDDNLIINVIPGKNNGISLLESEKQLTSLTNEVKRSNKPQIPEDMLSLGRLGIQKRKAIPIDKKRKSVQIERYGKALASPTHKRKRSLNIPPDRLEELVESSPSEQETSAKQSVEKGFGLQKSAQMEVSKSFSLSRRSGGVSSIEELPESGNPNSSDCNKEKHFMDVSKDGNSDGESSQLKEQVVLSKAQAARQDLDPNKAARGASWLHKSSWTQLVGNGNGTSFSISQILSGTNFEKPNVEEPDGINSNHLDFVKRKIIDIGRDGCQVLYPQKEVLLTAAPTFDVLFPDENKLSPSQSDKRHGREHERRDKVSCCDEPSASTSGKMCNYGPMKMADATCEISESCPFMRSAASVKEWTSAKAALSGSLKRKNK